MSTNPAQFWQEWLDKTPQGMAALMEQSQGWLRAMQQGLAAPAQGALPPEMPQLTFAPDKLLELQRNYIKEANELWNQCLHASPQLKDRRFKGEAWQWRIWLRVTQKPKRACALP